MSGVETILVAVAVAGAVVYLVRRVGRFFFRSEGGCCGHCPVRRGTGS